MLTQNADINVLVKNTNTGGNNQVDANYKKFYNWVLLNHRLLHTTNTQQINPRDIYDVALGCPPIDGTIVFAARNMYNSLVKKPVSFKNNCNNSEPFKMVKNKTKINTKNNEFLIYPNPTINGSATIAFKEKVGNATSIVVTDIFGKILYQKNNVNNKSIQLTINRVRGIYFVSVIDNATGTRQVKKLLIQ